jgi:hypothetical protein
LNQYQAQGKLTLLCGDLGYSRRLTVFCANCGKPIPDFSRFCPECGSTLANSRTAAETPQVPPPIPAQVPPPFQPPAASQFAPPHHNGMSGIGTRDQQPRGNLIYPRNPPISPHLALVTLMIVGLPQLVYGQVGKGILLFVLFWLSVPTVFGPAVILLLALIDAYMIGGTLKAGKPVSKWACFPSAR